MFRKRGLLLVICGPSGVGKGTVCRALFDRNPNMKFSVSATTRPRRPDEAEGVSYFFKTKEEFEHMIENGAFIEYMLLFGEHYYGTPREYVNDEVDAGHDIILEIDVNGAMRVKETYPDAVMIFIAPPAFSDLKSRLINRGSEMVEAMEVRLETARQELKAMDQYDYIVVNDVVDKAVSVIEAITVAEKAREKRNTEIKNRLIGGMN